MLPRMDEHTFTKYLVWPNNCEQYIFQEWVNKLKGTKSGLYMEQKAIGDCSVAQYPILGTSITLEWLIEDVSGFANVALSSTGCLLGVV